MKIRILTLLLIVCVPLVGCGPKLRQPNLFLVPNGYVGWLHVEYGVNGAPALPVQNGYRVYRFPRSGKIRTSSPLLFGWAKDKIYYTTPKGWKELTDSENQGKGMIWGGSASGSNEGGITTFDSKGNKSVIWTPATSDIFVGTWKQFYNRKTEAPISKEEANAWKALQKENLSH